MGLVDEEGWIGSLSQMAINQQPRALAFALVLLLSYPAWAQELAKTSVSQQKPAFEVSSQPLVTAGQANLASRLDKLEVAVAAQSDAYSRLEILIGLCSAIFGILITVLILIFGFRTERAAARAATDSAKEELKKSKEEIEEAVASARTSQELAASSLAKIRELEGEAERGSLLIIERLGSTVKAAPSEDEVAADADEAELAGDSAESSKVRAELQSKIDSAATEEDWRTVAEFAVALRAISEDPGAQIRALEVEARAYDRLADRENEIYTYQRIVALAESVSDPVRREAFAARAIANLGLTSKQAERPEEALEYFSQFTLRFKDSDADETVQLYAKVLNNKAKIYGEKEETDRQRAILIELVALLETRPVNWARGARSGALIDIGVTFYAKKMYTEAIGYSDKVLKEFKDDEGGSVAENVMSALFNKALYLELSGDLEAALKAYRQTVRRFGKSQIGHPALGRARTAAKHIAASLAEAAKPVTPA